MARNNHGYTILDAVKRYEQQCKKFKLQCNNVLELKEYAYYTRIKVIESFWLLAVFTLDGDKGGLDLICHLYRGTYKGQSMGRFYKGSLAEAIQLFPELNKGEWFTNTWPEVDPSGNLISGIQTDEEVEEIEEMLKKRQLQYGD